MFYDQNEFNIRCEWGVAGITQLEKNSDVIIIVDVLCFSTCVEIAVSRGAIVFPYRWQDKSAEKFAESHQAILAESRGHHFKPSLSPNSLLNLPTGSRLVLPSPNGAELSLLSGNVPLIAGSLRNAAAVAKIAMQIGKRISVVPAGERWEDKSLRPSFEDLVGAGAIISMLKGTRSPEATAAANAFLPFAHNLSEFLLNCSSGKELKQLGFENDVQLAAELNISDQVPILIDGAYHSYKTE